MSRAIPSAKDFVPGRRGGNAPMAPGRTGRSRTARVIGNEDRLELPTPPRHGVLPTEQAAQRSVAPTPSSVSGRGAHSSSAPSTRSSSIASRRRGPGRLGFPLRQEAGAELAALPALNVIPARTHWPVLGLNRQALREIEVTAADGEGHEDAGSVTATWLFIPLNGERPLGRWPGNRTGRTLGGSPHRQTSPFRLVPSGAIDLPPVFRSYPT